MAIGGLIQQLLSYLQTGQTPANAAQFNAPRPSEMAATGTTGLSTKKVKKPAPSSGEQGGSKFEDAVNEAEQYAKILGLLGSGMSQFGGQAPASTLQGGARPVPGLSPSIQARPSIAPRGVGMQPSSDRQLQMLIQMLARR